jgi:hypothetical protein
MDHSWFKFFKVYLGQIWTSIVNELSLNFRETFGTLVLLTRLLSLPLIIFPSRILF